MAHLGMSINFFVALEWCTDDRRCQDVGAYGWAKTPTNLFWASGPRCKVIIIVVDSTSGHFCCRWPYPLSMDSKYRIISRSEDYNYLWPGVGRHKGFPGPHLVGFTSTHFHFRPTTMPICFAARVDDSNFIWEDVTSPMSCVLSDSHVCIHTCIDFFLENS